MMHSIGELALLVYFAAITSGMAALVLVTACNFATWMKDRF
jgi:hypothetical protein